MKVLQRLIMITTVCCMAGQAQAQKTVAELPVYNEKELTIKEDWLVKKITQKSGVYRSEDGKDIFLSNGLVTRRIRLSPNVTTVSLKRLSTGEEFLRAARLEAIIELDGQTFNIGGLEGQPNHAFLKEEWLGKMYADPSAFQFSGFETGETEAPFDWEKRSKWMPKDLPWPAPGKSRTLNFKVTDAMMASLVATKITDVATKITDMDKARDVVLEDDFSKTTLAKEWKENLSNKSDRSSFQNEGKPGEITVELRKQEWVRCHEFL